MQMVEQMEDRVNSNIDSFAGEVQQMRDEVAHALGALSKLLEGTEEAGSGGFEGRLHKMQAAIDLLEEGCHNADSCAQVRRVARYALN